LALKVVPLFRACEGLRFSRFCIAYRNFVLEVRVSS